MIARPRIFYSRFSSRWRKQIIRTIFSLTRTFFLLSASALLRRMIKDLKMNHLSVDKENTLNNHTHRPVLLESTGKKKQPYRRCLVCFKLGRRSETKWKCLACGVALHPPACFSIYHTDPSLAVGNLSIARLAIEP